ncbi:1-acylglycerol-3-phosphate O-acyltransferase [Selaginella moellendorffii]|nr:1-acylglycerol-3-phosphate O-acyltransferase [Selaginella moellendorffii]|eukprot:XP_002987001.2 1-acylglycerol-3-phosphate O-acyltransferase [Selaginella moellendorffii]
MGLRRMADKVNPASSSAAAAEASRDRLWFASWMRWIPTSRSDVIQSEQRLLTLVKTPYVQEQVNIGSGPPGSKVRWFRSASNQPRFINTVTFENKNAASAPTLVMVHGYAASQGFFFRNFDALAAHFRIIAMDQLGWGASSRPDFTCTSTEETEAWFIDSFEEWRKAKNLDKFILLGHSFGGYVAARYALKHPEHVQHLILVGPAGFSPESDRFIQFRSTWKGAVANFFWDSNLTPQAIIRSLGPWGPNLVRRYTGARFGTYASGNILNEQESTLLSDYIYHTLAGRASGELCLKYIFKFGAFARSPLQESAPHWKVPTSFIYGVDDWMDYKGGIEASKRMKVPSEVIRVRKGGHFVFLDNAVAFHAAVLYSCRKHLPETTEKEAKDDGDFFPAFSSFD